MRLVGGSTTRPVRGRAVAPLTARPRARPDPTSVPPGSKGHTAKDRDRPRARRPARDLPRSGLCCLTLTEAGRATTIQYPTPPSRRDDRASFANEGLAPLVAEFYRHAG